MSLFDAFKKNSLISKARKLFYQDKLDEAMECYDKVLEMDLNYAKAWYGKGIIFLRFMKIEDAIKCFDKSLELNPNYKDAKRIREETESIPYLK